MADKENMVNVKNNGKRPVSVNGAVLLSGASTKGYRSKINPALVKAKVLTITEISEKQIDAEAEQAKTLVASVVAKITADKDLLNAETDFTNGGVPKVDAIERIAGDDSVDGDIRDAVWAEVKELYPEA